MIALGDIFGAELLGHDIEIGFAVSSTKGFSAITLEDVAVFTESVGEVLCSGSGNSILKAGFLGDIGTLVRAIAPSILTISIKAFVG